ncbi:hypothetical protein VCHA53O466_40209 [Vibrio chagasii]|nr:hypothetical protein VCHA53O466_40209 [Vibrio chagasii]
MKLVETIAKPISEQDKTSKNTSINSKRLPKGVTVLINHFFINGMVVLDYGAGKFDNSKEAIEKSGAKYLPFDPYNRTNESNVESITYSVNNDIDFIICSNVLNVIDSDVALDKAIERITSLMTPSKTTLILNVYEGNRNGIGSETRKDQYQRNEKLNAYTERFKIKGFNTVKLDGCAILRVS